MSIGGLPAAARGGPDGAAPFAGGGLLRLPARLSLRSIDILTLHLVKPAAAVVGMIRKATGIVTALHCAESTALDPDRGVHKQTNARGCSVLIVNSNNLFRAKSSASSCDCLPHVVPHGALSL